MALDEHRRIRACERARFRAALAADGELSMLEERSLRVHLERCPSCARVASDIETITVAIRSAPLEQPSNEITVPAIRRRRVLRRVPGAHLASQLAAVAAGAVLAVTVGSWSSDDPVATVPVRPIVIDETTIDAVDAEPIELRVYRHASLLDQTAAAPRLGKHPGTQPA